MNKTLSLSPEPPQTRPAGRTAAALLKAGAVVFVAGALFVIFSFNPQQHGFYPFCMFHRMTGLLCPGCGSLRAIHELLHGHLLTAARFNPLLVASLPLLLIWAAKKHLRRSKPPKASSVSPVWIWSAMAVLLVFGIVRNLPLFRNSPAGF